MTPAQLHSYAKRVASKHVIFQPGQWGHLKATSINVKLGRFMFNDLTEGRNVDNCDRAIIVSLPMSKGEKAVIYEIVDRNAYGLKKIAGSDTRLYNPDDLKIVKEITHAGINKKLYENNFSKYKK